MKLLIAPLLLALGGLGLLAGAEAAVPDYPQSMNEIYYMNRVAEGTSPFTRFWGSKEDKAQDVLDRLNKELAKFRAQRAKLTANGGQAAEEEAQHRESMLQAYAEMARVTEAKCEEAQVTRRVFIINFHALHESADDLMNYLRHYAWRQFELCKPKWDAEMKEMVERGLTGEIRQDMAKMIDLLMSRCVFNKDDKPLGQRPYERVYLAQMAELLPRKGLLLFLQHKNQLQLNEKLQMPGFEWEKFLQVVDEGLMPTCRQVCDKVRPVVRPYKLMFEDDVFNSDKLTTIFAKGYDDQLWEWMAGAKICCRVVSAREQLDKKVLNSNLLRQAWSDLSQ